MNRPLMEFLLRATGILCITVFFAAAVPVDATAPQTKQETQTAATREIGRRLNGKGVPNFGEVTPSLYRGGLLQKQGLKALKQIGIIVVIDNRRDDKRERKLVE